MTSTRDDTDTRLDDAPTDEPVEPDGEEGRYASLDLENGEVVIYDPDNHRAWIQSDDATEIENAD